VTEQECPLAICTRPLPRPVTRGGRDSEAPLEKCVGYNLKLLYIEKIWPYFTKLFALRSVPSWLRACVFLTL